MQCQKCRKVAFNFKLAMELQNHGLFQSFQGHIKEGDFIGIAELIDRLNELGDSEEDETKTEGKDAPDYIRAHRHCTGNKQELASSELCGCFYCLAIFSPKSITLWADETHDDTAWCPHCGIDSIIASASGYPITKKFMQKMQAHWFGIGTIIGEATCEL